MDGLPTDALVALFDSISATGALADALFTLAATHAMSPEHAWALRSIARSHRVKIIELEARLVAANDMLTWPSIEFDDDRA